VEQKKFNFLALSWSLNLPRRLLLSGWKLSQFESPISVECNSPSSDPFGKTLHTIGCQIFFGTTYQNGENIPNDHKIYRMAGKLAERPQNIPNGGKIGRTATKYTNIFHWKALTKFTQIGIFGLKIYVPSGNPATYLEKRSIDYICRLGEQILVGLVVLSIRWGCEDYIRFLCSTCCSTFTSFCYIAQRNSWNRIPSICVARHKQNMCLV
jgi:hypothetical protein